MPMHSRRAMCKPIKSTTSLRGHHPPQRDVCPSNLHLATSPKIFAKMLDSFSLKMVQKWMPCEIGWKNKISIGKEKPFFWLPDGSCGQSRFNLWYSNGLLKKWAGRSFNDLELRMPSLHNAPASRPCKAYQGDALINSAKISADVAYLDPPYNQHKYLGNYHIWESLVKWDKPEVYGVARKRVDVKQQKEFFQS